VRAGNRAVGAASASSRHRFQRQRRAQTGSGGLARMMGREWLLAACWAARSLGRCSKRHLSTARATSCSGVVPAPQLSALGVNASSQHAN